MPKSFYDAVGGIAFDAIVSRFLAWSRRGRSTAAGVPKDDLAGAEGTVRMFRDVLGRPTNLLGTARPPPIADAACPRFGSAHRTRRRLRCMHTAVITPSDSEAAR